MVKGMFLAVVIVILGAGICIFNYIYIRRKYILFTQKICECIDQILSREGSVDFELSQETLDSKVQMRLKRLADITEAALAESEQQKQEVQGIVSDISHQLKTPIANITMYCDTVLQQNLPPETRQECLVILDKQVKKLEFLTQSLLKMSRLENDIINLHPEKYCVRDTLYEVVESIRPKADRKGISIQIICPEEISMWYDVKWTSEAIFNVVDNSVKYTQEGGNIKLTVESLEMYTKIMIEDNGAGIAPEHINDVCKRFFREDKASRIEGVGIGMYLTREIIMKQNGYVKIQSELEKGTNISLYLLNGK